MLKNTKELKKIITKIINESKVSADTSSYRKYAKGVDIIKTEEELLEFLTSKDGKNFLDERYGKKSNDNEERKSIEELIDEIGNKRSGEEEDISSFRIQMMIKGLIHVVNAFLVSKNKS